MKNKLTRSVFLEIKKEFRDILNTVQNLNKEYEKYLLNEFKIKFPNAILKIASGQDSLNKSVYEGLGSSVIDGQIRFHQKNYHIIDLPYTNSDEEYMNFLNVFAQWSCDLYHNFFVHNKKKLLSDVFDEWVETSKYSELNWNEKPVYMTNTQICKSNNFIKRQKNSQFYKDWVKYIQKGKSLPLFPGDEKYDEYKEEIELLIGNNPTSESDGERRIRVFLSKLKIKFKPQQRFKNCCSVVGGRKYKLPFDFFIPSKNIVIEYDGEQHFKPIEHFGGVLGFEKRIERDNIKNIFCKTEKLNLIRIPYTEKENIEKILLDVIS